MAGYLEEKATGEGHILTWQTPNRQRLWGLGIAVLPAVALIWDLSDLRKVSTPLVVVSSILLLAAFLVATWTVKFSLNLQEGTFQFVKGFLPVLLGEKGKAKDEFQCLAVRQEQMLDAGRHENNPHGETFDQFRLLMVWKNPRREAMLLDTMPQDFAHSLRQLNFHELAMARAQELCGPLGVPCLDQSQRATAAVMLEESAEAATQS